jgi:hypothetical protein
MRSLLDLIHEDQTVTTTVTYAFGSPISEEHTQSVLPPRRRATPGIRFSRRQQERLSRPQDELVGLADNVRSELVTAGHQLARMNREAEAMNREVNRLLEDTGSARSGRPRSLDESRYGQLSRKRRRLDKTLETIDPVPYGYHGQAVPARLRMQLISCDGGDLGHENTVENVLRNDSSVFCTRDSNCNMVLSHEGETMFTLSKLIIRRPGYNFSQPVQQGLIFASTDNSQAFYNTREHVMQSLSGTSRAFNTPESWAETYVSEPLPAGGATGALQEWYEHHCDDNPGGGQESEPHELLYPLEDPDDDEMPELEPVDPSTFYLPQATDSEDDIDHTDVPHARTQDRAPGARTRATRRDIDELVRRGLQTRANRTRRSQRPAETESPIDTASASFSRDPATSTATISDNSSNTMDDVLAPIAHFRFMRSYYNGTRMVNDPRRRSHRRNIPVLRPGVASLSEEDDEMSGHTIVDEPAAVEVDTPTMSRFIPFPPPDSEGDAPRRTTFGDGYKTTRVTTLESQSGCKMTIHFDPPISARYILLKLWQDGAAASTTSQPRSERGQPPIEPLRPVRAARSNTPPGLPSYVTQSMQADDAPALEPRAGGGLRRTASVRRRRNPNFEQDTDIHPPNAHSFAQSQNQTQGVLGEDLNIDIEHVEAWGTAGHIWMPSVDML